MAARARGGLADPPTLALAAWRSHPVHSQSQTPNAKGKKNTITQTNDKAARESLDRGYSCAAKTGRRLSNPVSYTHLRAHETLMNL
eukprot:5353126-Prymnesium_polylepis.1